MSNVINALLNMILVSIPEELFIVLLTLIFLKRYDLLDLRMWKQNLKWILTPILSTSIIINIFKYIFIIPKSIAPFISLFFMTTVLIFMLNKNSINKEKLYLKIITYCFLSFVIVGLIETLYYPIILNLLQKEMSFFNNNIWYNFLITIPARVIQICILIFIVIKKNNSIQINLFDTIIKNKFFSYSFIFILIIILTTIIYSTKLMMIDNVLLHLELIDQVIIVIILTSVPIILITWFLTFVNYLLLTEKKIQQTYKNLVIQDDVMSDVED